MHIVKSVGVLSVAKIMGLIYACMGLIFAPLFLLIGAIGSFAGQSNTLPFAGIFGVVGAVVRSARSVPSYSIRQPTTIAARSA